MDPRTIRDAAIARGVFDKGSDFYKQKWPDVTLLTINLLAPYQRQLDRAPKGKHLVLLSNAPPFRIMLNASNHPAKVDHRNTLAPWELRFLREGEIAATISFLAGPDGVLGIVLDDDLSAIGRIEKAREVEDQIIEALKAEIARRAA